MSESESKAAKEPKAGSGRMSPALWIVRYGIGMMMVVAGIVVLILNPAGVGVDGFGMSVGGGLSVILLNALFRFGVSGDRERALHEEAWRHFEQYGEWPDEPPPRGRA